MIRLGAAVLLLAASILAVALLTAEESELCTGDEMTITRINHFTAKPGSGDELHALVDSFLPHIRASDGCLGARLLRDVDNPDRIAVVEEWRDKDAHQASAASVPPGTFEKAMALMAGPPSGGYYRGG